ncbi:MAG: hypothetical protein NZ853_07175 [Leptospiraceae bacterium]|nr:hypothetical protein [Leptospiraceae bacterium]MDW7975785.1 hypothetical protein [Leptospiraceae bacterium]
MNKKTYKKTFVYFFIIKKKFWISFFNLTTYFLYFVLGNSFLYSQNKILSDESSNWRKLESSYVILYFPENYSLLGLKAFHVANQTVAEYSLLFRHNLTHQVIIFLYPSFRDFQSSHIIEFYLPEGVAGYTEPYFERVVLPYNGNEEETFHTLRHELVHSFQFDIVLNLMESNDFPIPSWFTEGMSEYLSIGTEGGMDEFLRDLVISNRLPDLYSLIDSEIDYSYYKIGQSVMYFIDKKWSKDHIILLFKNMLMTKNLQKSFYLTFQMDFFDFNILWKEFVYELYRKDVSFSKDIEGRLTFRYWSLSRFDNPFYFKPSLSSDGRYIAYITFDKIYPVVVIQELKEFVGYSELPPKKKIIISYLRDENFEEWQPLTTRLNLDERFIYIPTRSRSKMAIIKYDYLKEKIESVYYLPFDTFWEPFLSKNQKDKIVFTGSLRGFSDVYLLDLQSKQMEKLTNDFEYEYSPVLSFQEDEVYFVKKEKSIFHVKSINLKTKEIKTLFFLEEEIKSIQSGTINIRGSTKKGIYYIAKKNQKFQLFFYDVEQKKHYKIKEHSRDIQYFDFYQTTKEDSESKLIYTVVEEGIPEIYLIKDSKRKEEAHEIYGYNKTNYFEEITFLQKKEKNFLPQKQTVVFEEPNIKPYEYTFYRNFFPFIAVSGAFDNRGNSNVVFLGFGSMADLQKRHQLDAFITYQSRPVILNGEIQYTHRWNRLEWQTGLYSYSGVFVVLNPLDLSLNNILYNPFQRLLTNINSGIYSGFRYYLHGYSSAGIQLDLGRLEQIYLPRLPEQRPNEDVFKNHLFLRWFYAYDNAKYTIFGPLDGYALVVGYEYPINRNNYYREVYQTFFEFRYYHLFRNFSLFAYRFFVGMLTGKEAKNFPYRIGGYATIRGYDFQKFEGQYAFLMNLEYRFTFLEGASFGFPFRWNLGLIRGSLFLDLGSAFDDYRKFQAFKKGRTYDLKASIGVGLQWLNFLWFLLPVPGAIMKVEWASPYDGVKTLPFSRWQGRFSIGFNF